MMRSRSWDLQEGSAECQLSCGINGNILKWYLVFDIEIWYENIWRAFQMFVCRIARRSAFFNLSSSFNNSAESQRLIARLAVSYPTTHHKGGSESTDDWVMLQPVAGDDWVMLNMLDASLLLCSPLLSFFEGERWSIDPLTGSWRSDNRPVEQVCIVVSYYVWKCFVPPNGNVPKVIITHWIWGHFISSLRSIYNIYNYV